MQNYHRLSVWRKSHAIALNVYRITERISGSGHSGLISQLRRASLSIPANIVEGCNRATDRDFAKFLQIALASAAETEYHMEFAAAAGAITEREFALRKEELIEVRKMLSGLIKRLREGAGPRVESAT
jgi:four helix bundle protein